MGESGEELHYGVSTVEPLIDLSIPQGALSGINPVYVQPLLVDNAQLPAGAEPATYFVDVRNYDEDESLQFAIAGTLRMEFDRGSEILGFFNVLSDGSLEPYPAEIDPAGTITAEIWHEGTFVALTPSPTAIPTVSEWGLVVLTLLLLAGAKIVSKQERRALFARW